MSARYYYDQYFRIFASLFLVLTGFLFLLPNETKAGNFTQTILRIDNNKVSSQTGGMVCATPQTFGTEASIQVVFPSNFSVNSTAANWTISTSDLPSNATAWPGISTASSVSGQTVTFPSSDLNVGTFYCFNFSETNTLTTPSTAGYYNSAVVVSRNVGSSIIDSKEVDLAVVIANNITVTATVGPRPSDFLTELNSLNIADEYSQGEYILYELTYGSILPYAYDFTLQVEWSEGTIEGSNEPSLDMLNYALGSATNAYNSTPAVIDPQNRTISWHIDNFPSRTEGQKVYFALSIQNSYSGPETVNFEVMSRVIIPTFSTDEYRLRQYYKYRPNLPLPTPINIPLTNTPINLISNTVSDIEVRRISQTEASLVVSTVSPSDVTVRFGKNPNSLTKSVTSISGLLRHQIEIGDLEPDIQYYFRVEVRDRSSGRRVVSDLFTFKTAKDSNLPELVNESVVVTSRNVIISSSGRVDDLESVRKRVVSLPENSVFEFKFYLENHQNVNNIKALILNSGLTSSNDKSDVLGISTVDTVNLVTDQGSVAEIAPGEWVGRLKTPNEPGFYEVGLLISDISGNLMEEEMISLIVVDPFLIKNQNDKPIEHARVALSLYNPKLRIFQPLSELALQIPNPIYTDIDGTLTVSLPEGKYKAEISAIGYKSTSVEFAIGPKDKYPQVVLEKDPEILMNAIKYYSQTSMDLYLSMRSYVKGISVSNRFFDLILALMSMTFVCLALLSYSKKTKIPLLLLPFHIKEAFRSHIPFKNKDSYELKGIVTDAQTKSPLKGVQVFLIDQVSDRVVATYLTSKSGLFKFQLRKSPSYTLTFLKTNLEPYKVEGMKSADSGGLMKVALSRSNDQQTPVLSQLNNYFNSFFGLLFEFLLLGSIAFELVFIFTFSFAQSLPLIFITIINIFIWLKFIHQQRSTI